ncbi:hypothetical protein ANRL4_04009 [Anaerolineae bacterium]|nr:hypothetical protein ANRL4_04009 [Anaerolineae bacterium]
MGEREYRLKVRVTDDKVLVSNDNGSKQAEGELGKSDATLRQVVDTLQRWLRKGDVFQSENEFEVFGHCLFEILFPTPTIRDILKSSFNQAENARQILRIELEFNENNELARLPWEYLWYPERQQFMCRDAKMALTRYVRIFEEHNPIAADSLRIAVFQALLEEDEAEPPVARIQAYVDALRKRLHDLDGSRVRLTLPLKSLTFGEFQEEIKNEQTGKPNVLHLVAAGRANGVEGEIAFLGSAQTPRIPNWINAAALGNACRLGEGDTPLKLIILQVADQPGESSFAARLDRFVKTLMGRTNIPAVITIQQPMHTEILSFFMDNFYRRLLEKATVGLALQLARDALAMKQYDLPVEQKNMYAFGAPVLYMRTDSGQILKVAEAPPNLETVSAEPTFRRAGGIYGSGTAASSGFSAPTGRGTGTFPAVNNLGDLFQTARTIVRKELGLDAQGQIDLVTKLRNWQKEIEAQPDSALRREHFNQIVLDLDEQLDIMPNLQRLVDYLNQCRDML